MGLRIMMVTGFILVLMVGFCIGGAVTGEAELQTKTPFTVTMYECFSSFIDLFTGTDGNAAGGSAPEGATENSE
ncbi:hypothetical protein L1S32_08170 [Methanogenium sp. S4BF]|uniref:hypothetical protein n=1 Tax=Methanogenium sp. S4BF TaxID=1789226 RepID=UPI00241625EE|nr:hypothetical protein [Methanogenium sp. S4BF]WFN33816.1 hypothetical protein L1S32_08170 [Methanogenium sp. S4BF]